MCFGLTTHADILCLEALHRLEHTADQADTGVVGGAVETHLHHAPVAVEHGAGVSSNRFTTLAIIFIHPILPLLHSHSLLALGLEISARLISNPKLLMLFAIDAVVVTGLVCLVIGVLFGRSLKCCCTN